MLSVIESWRGSFRVFPSRLNWASNGSPRRADQVPPFVITQRSQVTLSGVVKNQSGTPVPLSDVYLTQTTLSLDDAVTKHLPEIGPKRTIVTHMSPEMLVRQDTLAVEAAHDGLVVEF